MLSESFPSATITGLEHGNGSVGVVAALGVARLFRGWLGGWVLVPAPSPPLHPGTVRIASGAIGVPGWGVGTEREGSRVLSISRARS